MNDNSFNKFIKMKTSSMNLRGFKKSNETEDSDSIRNSIVSIERQARLSVSKIPGMIEYFNR